MRHLRSILYTLFLAPTVWVLTGVGFTHDLSSRGRELFTAESLTGLSLLLLAGTAYAILVFAPVSPAGPFLAGAVFLGSAVWAWNDATGYAAVWPPHLSRDGFDLSRPGYGLAALLAVPLLGTVLSARRWAGYEPPVLPLIGPIGRARGSARVAGAIPVAAEATTVIPGANSGRDPAAAATQVIATPPASPADLTVALATASDETTVVSRRPQDASRPADELTAVIAPAADETRPLQIPASGKSAAGG